MSLAHAVKLQAPAPVEDVLDPVHARVIARSWCDRAADATELAARLDGVASGLLAAGDGEALRVAFPMLHAWEQIATTCSDLAAGFERHTCGHPTGLLGVGTPHPDATGRERVLQGVVDVLCLTATLDLTLLQHDLLTLDEGLADLLRPTVDHAARTARAAWPLLDRLRAAAAEEDRAAVSASLLGTFRDLERTLEEHTAPWIGLSVDLGALGVRDAATTRQLARAVVCQVIVPRLESAGLAAAWAWRRAH
jgi:hypothetical protein